LKHLIISVALFFFLTATAMAAAININTAGKKALESLPGIGPVKAEAIIQYRKLKKFESVEELTMVKGIGDNTMEKLKKELTVKGK